jgi:hypothetical protein
VGPRFHRYEDTFQGLVASLREEALLDPPRDDEAIIEEDSELCEESLVISNQLSDAAAVKRGTAMTGMKVVLAVRGMKFPPAI